MSRPRRRPRPQVGSFDAPASHVASAAVLAATACWFRTLGDPEHLADAPLLASTEWRQVARLVERHPDRVLAELERHYELSHGSDALERWRRSIAHVIGRSSAGSLLPAG